MVSLSLSEPDGPAPSANGWISTSYPFVKVSESSVKLGGCGGNCGSQTVRKRAVFATYFP